MNKNFLKYCFILLLSSGILEARIIQEEVTFKQIKIEDGLSQSTIFSILQDRKGFLWFGTANGLNRYDGYDFQIFTNDPIDSTTISDNGITAIHEDKKGFLWIGTTEGVLNKFDRKTGKFQRYYITEGLKTSGNPTSRFYEFPIPFSRHVDKTITSIAEGPDNSIWIGTWGYGLIRLNTHKNKIDRFTVTHGKDCGFQSGSVRALCIDGKYLWIGTIDGGLFRINNTGNSTACVNFKNQKDNQHSLSDNKIFSLYKDRSGNLWIGTFGGGLNKLPGDELNKSPEQARFIRYKHRFDKNSLSNDFITSIIQDKKGFIWIATYGGGIDKLRTSDDLFTNYKNDPADLSSLSKNDILSIYEDASGTIWAGTHLGKGLNKLENNIEKFDRVSKNVKFGNGLNDDVVWAIETDNDSIVWLGTYKGGLNKWNRRTGKFSYYKTNGKSYISISDNHIRSLKSDGKNLLVGTYKGGLNILDKRTGKIRNYINDPRDSSSIGANQIQAILIDRNKNYWIGTFGGGLNKLIWSGDSGKVKFKRYVFNPNNPFSLNDNRVYSLFEDRSGYIWIGTFGGGLSRFDVKNERFIAYKNIPGDETSLSDNRVMTIYEDKNGTLWVGTYGGGLHKFDRRTEKFLRYNEKNKQSNAVVYGILEDKKNNLWMSTDNGLFKLNTVNENFTRYDLHDGLQSLEFSGGAYSISKSGEMFFGGINGFNYFYPDSIVDNYFVPPVVLSSVKVFNQPFGGERDTICLSYQQNFLSLEFSALDYTNPQDNQYAYMLEGFDKVWHYVNSRNRTANYANLSPGEYIFKVRGTNSDGVWNNTGAKVYLIIYPPFWKTWWFISITILFAAFVIYYLGTVRYRNLLVIEKIKTKLSADLHDSIGSGLTEISILSELTSKEVETVLPESSQRLNAISEKARQLVDNMSDIVWMVNPHRDSLYHLMLRLKDSYSDFMCALGISFATINIEKFTDVKLPMDYRQNLFLIFKEAINNAIKHSKCKKLTLEANLNKDIFELVLKDDGIGIDYEVIKYGNGIQNMKSRANAIGGELIVESSNNGTIIMFSGKSLRFLKIVSFLK